jgi:isoleucyl-tRNA synthetase
MGYSANSNESKNLPGPADVCVSSDGQNAKWFQLSLLLPSAIEELPPFKAALVHGYVVDEDGRRVFGSENEAPSIPDLLDEFGTDVFRLWAASADCRKNLKISHSRLEAVSKVYRRVRNTCRFLLSNLSGYDPKTDRLDYANLDEIDHWALHRLAKLISGATEALEAYRFDLFYRLLHNFCSVDMGSRYLNIVRRRLYTYPRWSSSRRAVQTVIYEVLTSLTRLIAPVLSFTAEDIWRYIPGVKEDCPSVYLSHWPHVNGDFLNDELGDRWDNLLKIGSEIRRITEEVRQEEEISSLSQASVVIYASSQDVYNLLDRYIDDLETIFMVSRVRLNAPEVPVPDGIRESKSVKGLAIEVRRTTGEKCERCWIYSDTVGTNEQFPTLCYRCIDILEGGTYYI